MFWKKKPKITPGQKTVPGYAGPCEVDDTAGIVGGYIEYRRLLAENERRWDNIERRIRYRKTMRRRHLPVR